MRTRRGRSQTPPTPREALEILREGNARFQANLRANRDLLQQVNDTSEGQYPFAVVLSCIDSRTSAELIFDQGLGDIFSIRVAGNVLNDDVLGSMEFACKLAGSRLIVVLGHSSCGAVKGACARAELGHLTGLLRKITPAVDRVVERHGALEGDELFQRVAIENVAHVIDGILTRSELLRDMVSAGEVGVVGGMYSVASGAVELQELRCGPEATSDAATAGA